MFKILKSIFTKKQIQERDKIQIIYLPSCINVRLGTPNPYIGMSGEVRDLTDTTFSLFTGNSWLVGIKLKTVRYKFV